MLALLFDLGNVLIHYDHQQSLAAVAALCGVDTAVLRALHEEYGRDLGLGRLEPAAFCQLVQQRLGVAFSCESLFAAYCAGLARDDAALAYAVALQNRPELTVGVISNTNAIHVSWLDAHVPELDALDLVMMSNEVELLKPDPAVFELAMELLGVDPAQTLYVDDLPENVAAAQALGLAGLVHERWAETGPALEAWLASHSPPAHTQQ